MLTSSGVWHDPADAQPFLSVMCNGNGQAAPLSCELSALQCRQLCKSAGWHSRDLVRLYGMHVG